jgi:hypothetical protein
MVELYLHYPTYLHGAVLNSLSAGQLYLYLLNVKLYKNESVETTELMLTCTQTEKAGCYKG